MTDGGSGDWQAAYDRHRAESPVLDKHESIVVVQESETTKVVAVELNRSASISVAHEGEEEEVDWPGTVAVTHSALRGLNVVLYAFLAMGVVLLVAAAVLTVVYEYWWQINAWVQTPNGELALIFVTLNLVMILWLVGKRALRAW